MSSKKPLMSLEQVKNSEREENEFYLEITKEGEHFVFIVRFVRTVIGNLIPFISLGLLFLFSNLFVFLLLSIPAFAIVYTITSLFESIILKQQYQNNKSLNGFRYGILKGSLRRKLKESKK